MKLFSLFYVLIFACTSLSAQVKDTSHILKRPSEFSLFSSDDTLTRNDYLLSIEKVFQTLNKASVLSQPVPSIMAIGEKLAEDDSAIHIINDRLNSNDRGLNVRNLQMFTTILKQINKNSKAFAKELSEHDSILNGFKQQILAKHCEQFCVGNYFNIRPHFTYRRHG